MNTNMTRFNDAVYHKLDSYDFGETEFTRRELKVLLLINGKRTVSDISELLQIESNSLTPSFANLVKLGLIQTEGGIISTNVADIMYSDATSQPPVEFTLARLPAAV